MGPVLAVPVGPRLAAPVRAARAASVQRLYDFYLAACLTKTVRFLHDYSAASERCPYGDHAMPATKYLRATGLRFRTICKACITFFIQNRRGCRTREYVKNLTATACLRTDIARKGRYGQSTGSVETAHVKGK